METSDITYIRTVDEYNQLFGVETRHPLITVVDVPSYTPRQMVERAHYALYAIFLKQGVGCTLRYGRQLYDYQEGSIVCFAPGQTVTVSYSSPGEHASWKALLFHPDLLYGTHLAHTISDYHYFDYDQHEALHLSHEERQVIEDTLAHIAGEMEHAVDTHSQSLLTVYTELVLNYCQRFYDRQFITRRKENSSLMARFERLLKAYLGDGRAKSTGLPTVAYFASELCLSPGYFGDLVKKETGLTAQDMIQQALLMRGKHLLRTTDLTITEIAYQLGFQYPQHFTRFFKTLEGISPKEYRESA